jgi:hypothetical protein
MDVIARGVVKMEKKTFAFKLADEGAKGARKWQARDGVALAGCTEVGIPPRTQWRDGFNHPDDWYYC